jgi:hypothetical protein
LVLSKKIETQAIIAITMIITMVKMDVGAGVGYGTVVSPLLTVQLCDTVGLLVVVPQLLESVHVLVCWLFVQADQAVQVHDSVQVAGVTVGVTGVPPLVPMMNTDKPGELTVKNTSLPSSDAFTAFKSFHLLLAHLYKVMLEASILLFVNQVLLTAKEILTDFISASVKFVLSTLM